MTEKRFKYHIGLICEKKDGEYNLLTIKEVTDLLNKLFDENEQLRKEKIDVEVRLYSANEKILMQMDYDEIIKQNTESEMEIINLKKENEQLNQRLKISNDNVKILQCENEQLKNKIDVLEDDNETYHKSLEKINLYTKRFIPTKCTNEFKDCKTNRYYWLDHEGNFEGCLELLNLLDCERELLESENRQLKGRLMEYEEQIRGDLE